MRSSVSRDWRALGVVQPSRAVCDTAVQSEPREQADCSYGGAYQSKVAARGTPTCVIIAFHVIRSHGGIVAMTLKQACRNSRKTGFSETTKAAVTAKPTLQK